MIANYFKTAFRNLVRHKSFSIINISGLSIGMASALLILLWVQNEVGHDRFFSQTNRIYMMYNRNKVNNTIQANDQTPNILATTLKKDYPEVAQVSRFNNITFLVTAGEKHLNLQGAFADSSFLTLFDFPMLQGQPDQALQGKESIVITQQLAKKLFGDENAIGKIVRIDSNANFVVSAVLQDLPANTSFHFEYLLPWSFMSRLNWEDFNWTNNFTYTYVLLKPRTTQEAFDKKVKNIIIDHTRGAVYESRAEVFTQPLSRTYLFGKSENGKLVAGRLEMVRLFTIIAIFILLIACINFMNLSTARSEKRAREVGIRKVSGALRSSLFIQFISESILLSLFAFVAALMLVVLTLPAFNNLVGSQLVINYQDPLLWIFSIGFVLLTGFIAGSYPAIYLSSFAPAKVLKGTFKNVHALIAPRKILVVLQFSFAIVLIISTIIIKYQIEYVRDRDPGYNRNNLVYTFAQGDIDKHFDVIKQQLLSSGTAVSVTRCASPITRNWSNGSGYEWNGSTESDTRLSFDQLGSDANLVKTMGLTLVDGRDIEAYQYPADSLAMLLNESAVKTMHLKNPVGQVIRRKNYPEQWHVVGVVKDFIAASPFERTIRPMVISGPNYFLYIVHFKLNPANSASVNLARAEKIFKKYNPQYPFEYVFVDEAYANKFREEQQTGYLAALFAGLTIFISCLGLYGLASYMAENRIKEIGVRKVLGASVASITSLLSRDFLKLVIIAFLIATPLAWWSMNQWLQTFSYRVNMEWWIFAMAGSMAIIIALGTVSYQAIKAAVSNPVKSLKTE